MSSIKWRITNAEDRYWEMRTNYETLITAIKEQDTVKVAEMVKEWDEFEKREEDNRKKWLEKFVK